MVDTALWDFINAINSDQLKELSRMIAGEATASGREKKLFAELFQAAKLGKTPKREELWASLHRSGWVTSKYQSSIFNNIVSACLEQLYRAYQQLYAPKIGDPEFWLTERLIEMGLNRQAARKLKRIEQNTQKLATPSSRYHAAKSHYHELKDQLNIRRKRDFSPDLQLANDHLDLAYYTNKLRLACDMVSRNRIIPAAYQAGISEPLLASIATQTEDQPPARIYLLTYRLLTAEESYAPEHYQSLRSYLSQHPDQLPPPELRTVYDYLINYQISRVNHGEHHFYQELLSSYQELLDNQLILIDGTLSEWTYANVATTGIRSKAYDWTLEFLNHYRQYLKPEVADNAYRYNIAALYFDQEDYTACLDELLAVEFTHSFYYVSARLLLLKIYYFQQDHRAFTSTSETVRIYLLRNRQLGAYQLRGIKAFVRQLKKLFKLKDQQKRKKKAAFATMVNTLREKIEAESELVQRGWLLEELEVLL